MLHTSLEGSIFQGMFFVLKNAGLKKNCIAIEIAKKSAKMIKISEKNVIFLQRGFFYKLLI